MNELIKMRNRPSLCLTRTLNLYQRIFIFEFPTFSLELGVSHVNILLIISLCVEGSHTFHYPHGFQLEWEMTNLYKYQLDKLSSKWRIMCWRMKMISFFLWDFWEIHQCDKILKYWIQPLVLLFVASFVVCRLRGKFSCRRRAKTQKSRKKRRKKSRKKSYEL